MFNRIKYIMAVVVIGGLLMFVPHFFSSAAARPQSVRIVIHEHRLLFQRSDCLGQHHKEHLYSRLVDKELTKRGYTAFSVDAVAAIDKIIVSVEHWGEPEELANIAQAAVLGIKKRPPAHLVQQERALVTYEDGLLAEAPQQGALATAALLEAAAPSHSSCSAERVRSAADNLSEWAPGDFEVYESQGEGQYTRLFSSYAGMSTFPNAWNSLPVPLIDPHPNSAVFTPNSLFVAYKGGADKLSTTMLLAAIYDAIVGSEIEAKDVRPFGKAGFIIDGEEKVLVELQKNLRKAFGSPPGSRAQSNNLRRAWASVCGFRTKEHKGKAHLFDERIAHTYFEYNTQGTSCEKVPDIASTASDLIITSILIQVPKTSSEPSSYEGQMPFELCIPKEEFAREDLSISAYALRQYLRFDVGLALNIRFSKIEGNCVNGSIFAPKANTRALTRLLKNFDSANDAYTARYSSATTIYYCSKGSARRCPNKNTRRPVIEPPRLNFLAR